MRLIDLDKLIARLNIRKGLNYVSDEYDRAGYEQPITASQLIEALNESMLTDGDTLFSDKGEYTIRMKGN